MQPTHPPAKAPTSSGLIPVALLLGVYLLTAVVVGGCVALGVWIVLNSGRANAGVASRGLLLLVLIVVPVLSGVFVSARKGRNLPAPGVQLSPAGQPLLWATVSELAQAVGTRPPDEIRLVAEVDASVTSV